MGHPLQVVATDPKDPPATAHPQTALGVVEDLKDQVVKESVAHAETGEGGRTRLRGQRAPVLPAQQPVTRGADPENSLCVLVKGQDKRIPEPSERFESSVPPPDEAGLGSHPKTAGRIRP